MTLATMPEEPALARLDEIEVQIAGLLTEGALFPEKRKAAARDLVTLYQEGMRISENPASYQPTEPWAIKDETERERRVRQITHAAFRAAPQGDALTDALVEIWTRELSEAAAGGDAADFNAAARRMETDARAAAETIAEACTLPRPSTPENPAAFLQALKVLTEQALIKIERPDRETDGIWERAARHALRGLIETIEWLQSQGVDSRRETTADRRAAATGVVALAEEFNEIRFAIRRRCR